MKVLILICLAVLCASTQNVDVEFDQAANFGTYHTSQFAGGQLNSRNPALNSELVRKRIEADIERVLSARGLLRVTGPADLNVRFHLGAARKAELETYSAGWRGWGTRVVRVPYTEGTLVIDLSDPTRRSLLWSGIAREDKSDATKIESKLDDMVRKSISKKTHPDPNDHHSTTRTEAMLRFPIAPAWQVPCGLLSHTQPNHWNGSRRSEQGRNSEYLTAIPLA